MHEFKRRFPPPPLDWSRHRLADIADRVTTRNVECNPNVLTISAEFGLISQSEFFSRRVASESVAGYFLLERGDFAYNKSYSRGYPLGAIRRLDRYENGCVSPLYICFRPRSDAVDTDFLLHYLDGGAIDEGLADVAKEGVRNHGLLNVGVADFFALEVPLPPVAEQRVAAQVLDTLDTTIRQTETSIKKLKQVKQGLLHDLLTRGVDANGEMRPPHSQAPHLYKESPLGWIPRNWGTAMLSDLTEPDSPITYGVVKPGPEVDGGVAFIRGGDIYGGRVLIEQLRTIGADVSREYRRTLLRGGELLMSLVGYPGEVAVVPSSLAGANIARQAALIRLRAPTNAIYVMHYLASPAGNRQVLASSLGSAQQVVNLGDLRNVFVPLATAAEQELICERLAAATGRIDQENEVMGKLRHLKSGLLDDLLTGRVRVTPLLA